MQIGSQKYSGQEQGRQEQAAQPENYLNPVVEKCGHNKSFDTMNKDNINFSLMEWKEAR